MKKLKITLPPEVALDPLLMQSAAVRKAGFEEQDRVAVRVKKRSIDARGKQIRVHLELELYPPGEIPPAPEFSLNLDPVDKKDPVILVGAGPAGLFAALKLIELGLKPVIVERGKDVRSRRRDVAAINRQHVVDPDSNYCFGEGGAGTYSDGKLYTRSKKRGDVQRVLQILASHGAPEDILVDNHPHIGTNKLPKVVKALRETILQAGGEIHFQSRVEDLIRKDDCIMGVKDQNGQRYKGKAVILATGHSARDIFSLLHREDLQLQLKPFAIGVRVEHPQALIDSIQYRRATRGLLPAASYQLSHQLNDNRGVFSFCMCPGGFIVPSATSPGELVVNGMSPSRRDSQFANSGIVISVDERDFQAYSQHGPLAGLYFQKAIEEDACQHAGGKQAAPAQKLMDFLDSKTSTSLLDTSYQPGLASVNLPEILPAHLYQGIKAGLRVFGKKMPGYLTNDAQVVAVESRTSSPVRIPRDPMTLQHPQVKGLFPCGEGAGYAGGIMSAALDGIRCAEAVTLMK